MQAAFPVVKSILDGAEVDFCVLVAANRLYEVFPVPTLWDVTVPSVLRPEPLLEVSFIVDENAHRLAGLLRMIGVDAVGCRGLTDEDIVGLAVPSTPGGHIRTFSVNTKR